MSCILYKFPAEVREYAFEFADQKEIAELGQTLTGTPVIDATLLSGTNTLSVGTPAISGTKVIVTLSAGTLDARHKLICRVDTSGGATIAAKGELRIKETC